MNDTTTIPSPTIALVTDRNLAGGIDALVAAVADAVDGGVNLVQMREKDLPDAEQLELAKRLREAIAGRALLFVNDSMSVAEAVRCGWRAPGGEVANRGLGALGVERSFAHRALRP